MTKRLLSFALVLTMLFAFAVPAMAANDNGEITTNLVNQSDGTALLTVTYTSGNNSIKAATFELVGTGYKSGIVPFDKKSGTFTFILNSDVPVGTTIRMTEDKGNKPVVVNGVFKEGYTAPCVHDFVAGEVVPSKVVGEVKNFVTNTYEMGYTIYTCTKCGETEKRDFNEWITYTVAPNCSQEGYTVKRHIPSGEGWFSDYVDALGHTWGDDVWDGHGWLNECSVCGWAGYVSYDACKNGHDYVSGTPVAPTCTEGGYTIYTCSRCGDNYEDDRVEANGHSYDEDVTEPTCTEGGYTTFTCSVCTNTYDGAITDALGHNWVAGAVTAPTCTVQGHTAYTCDRDGCNEGKDDDFVNALGHDLSEALNREATCLDVGYAEYSECSRCDYTEGEILPALGHDWEDANDENYTSPTREADGYWTLACKRDACEDTDTVVDEGSKWVVTGATAAIINRSGNNFQIQITETYSGGADEVYVSAVIEGNKAIDNNSSADFVVGPYTVTVNRGSGNYTPGDPRIAPAAVFFSLDEGAEDDLVFEVIDIIRID